MNLFEIASREAFRFTSNKGELTVEQLWQLPLQSKSGFDLDNVAKGINATIKTLAEESFVSSANPTTTVWQMKLDLVKHIIGVKLEELRINKAKVDNAALKAKLTGILEEKQDVELQKLTPEEIRARIAAL